MELTVCPPTSAQCLPTNCPSYVFQIFAQHIPNICPTYAQCLPNVCHMSPMSAQCSRCLHQNVPDICQILDFLLYVLFILQLLTDGMTTRSSIFMRTGGWPVNLTEFKLQSAAIQIPVCFLGTREQNITRAKCFWPEQAQLYFLADIGMTGKRSNTGALIFCYSMLFISNKICSLKEINF